MRGKLLMIATAIALLPSAALSSTRSSIPEGMCEVVLEAHNVFGKGVAGYQLILDADHFTYGEYFQGPQSSYYGDYSEFEYTLPEDAEAVRGTDKCLYDGTLTLQIPAGTYDYMIVRPDYESLDIISGEYAAADDFEFKAGETYHFIINEVQGMYGTTDEADLIVNKDICISSLNVPASGLNLSAEEIIGVTIVNNGKNAASGISLTYTINDGEAVTESISDVIAVGESLTYEFNKRADLSNPGAYTIVVTANYADDLKPANNKASAVTRHLQATDLPFEYIVADNKDTFAQDWIIIDNNGDGTTWQFNEWISNIYGKDGVLACGGCMSGTFIGDDWLISNPLNMKAGMNHVAFDMRSVLGTAAETLEVCIGTSLNVADMKVVATFEVASEAWVKKAANFAIEEDGIYFVAFHAVSKNGYNQFIGEITVEEGEFIGKPEISVTRGIYPISNCDLPKDGKVGLTIENRGTADLKDFTITCSVTGPNSMSKTVSSTFAEVLAIDGSNTFMIEEGVDFSGIGTYTLQYKLESADTEVTYTSTLECFEPITTPDLYTNFSRNENTEIWTPITEGGWTYNSMFADYTANLHGVDYGLLSRGLTMNTPMRARISYVASGWGESKISILFGKAGADISTYTPVYEAVANNVAEEIEFEVPVVESGNYSFIIADTGEGYVYLRINDFFVSPVCEYDLKIESAEGFIAPYMPEQFMKSEGTVSAVVVNRGTKDMSGVKLIAIVDNSEIGTSEDSVTIKSGESATIPVKVLLSDYSEGDEFTLELEVRADEADQYDADNFYAFSKSVVTFETFANESITEPVYGTGNYGEPLYVGNIFEISQTADLTSMEIGLSPTDESSVVSSRIGIKVYTVEGDKIGRCIYSEERERGNGGTIESIDFDDMRIPAGKYYFEVAQLGLYNYGLAYDETSIANCYQRIGDTLNKVTSYALAIRACFKEMSVVYAKNATAVGFNSPTMRSALFSDDETIKAVVRNGGYENATFDAKLLVDSKLIETKHIENLLPYEYIELVFENVDLSAPGTRAIEILTELADDEFNSDNRKYLVIVSQKEEDPYTLNFESCNDFDANGDRFNPRWTTIDHNGVATDGWWRYEYKNRYESNGFIAFNPKSTTPSMSEEPLPGVGAYEGNRFGLAFCYDKFAEGAEQFTQSDVWLVSPMLELFKNSTFSLYVKGTPLENPERKVEPYRLLVSEEAEGFDNFVVLGDETRYANAEEWTFVEADLSAYDNKKVRVAVQYIGVPIENVCLMVDNLKVNTATAGVENVTPANVALRYDKAAGKIIIDGNVAETICIYGIDGTMIKRANANVVDVTDLPAGSYIAKSKVGTLKFIK